MLSVLEGDSLFNESRGRPGQIICFILILMWFMCFSSISAVGGVFSVLSLAKSLSVSLIFSRSQTLVLQNVSLDFPFFLLIPMLIFITFFSLLAFNLTCSFSCLHFIYLLEESGEHLCHNTGREVIGQLEGAGSLLEPCGFRD